MTLTHHLHQLAAHAWHAGEHAAGRRAAERLLDRRLPEDLERMARRNRTWYTRGLDELAGTRFHRIDLEPAGYGWGLFNPSIVAHDRGWLLAVRSANYEITPAGYVMDDPAGVIRSKTILATLADDLTALDQVTLADFYDRTDFPVDGLEDVRLNLIDGTLHASATIRNLAGLDGTCRIAATTIDRLRGKYTTLHCPHTPDGQHEKNWMPILGRRAWLYAAHKDGHVAIATPAGDSWQIDLHAASPHKAAGFRGGSQLVPLGDGTHLAIVHEVASDDDGRRVYEHRFVRFDEPAGWSIVGLSPLFYFREHRTIEFCAGMDRKGDRLVATFGVRDREAWLVEMHLPEILATLETP